MIPDRDMEKEATRLAGRFLTSALSLVATETRLERVHEVCPAGLADRFASLVAGLVAAQVRLYVSLSGEGRSSDDINFNDAALASLLDFEQNAESDISSSGVQQ